LVFFQGLNKSQELRRLKRKASQAAYRLAAPRPVAASSPDSHGAVEARNGAIAVGVVDGSPPYQDVHGLLSWVRYSQSTRHREEAPGNKALRFTGGRCLYRRKARLPAGILVGVLLSGRTGSSLPPGRSIIPGGVEDLVAAMLEFGLGRKHSQLGRRWGCALRLLEAAEPDKSDLRSRPGPDPIGIVRLLQRLHATLEDVRPRWKGMWLGVAETGSAARIQDCPAPSSVMRHEQWQPVAGAARQSVSPVRW